MNNTFLIVSALLTMWALGAVCGSVIRNRSFRSRLNKMLETEREVANANSNSRVSVMAESQRAYLEMKPELDAIALYLREHYATEIQLGYHANRKLSEIVCGYLGRERHLTALSETWHKTAGTQLDKEG